MNKHKPFIDLESTRPSPKRPLELPFEKKSETGRQIRAQSSAISPYLRKIEPKTANSTQKTEETSEVRSLYGAIDEVENRLARRLERLQQKLIVTQQKIEFQQRCFALFIVLGLGWICLTLARPSESRPQRTNPQIQPSQLNHFPVPFVRSNEFIRCLSPS